MTAHFSALIKSSVEFCASGGKFCWRFNRTRKAEIPREEHDENYEWSEWSRRQCHEFVISRENCSASFNESTANLTETSTFAIWSSSSMGVLNISRFKVSQHFPSRKSFNLFVLNVQLPSQHAPSWTNYYPPLFINESTWPFHIIFLAVAKAFSSGGEGKNVEHRKSLVRAVKSFSSYWCRFSGRRVERRKFPYRSGCKWQTHP